MTFKIISLISGMFLLPIRISPVDASELVVNGADAQWGANLEVSDQLRNVGSVVKPRIIAQYSNTIYASGLTKVPETLNNLASTLALSRRLIINQAGSAYLVTLTVPSEIIGGVSVEEKTDLPQVFTLFQNHPNPFNPRTEISFHLPESSYITLTVFNALGQNVFTLIDGRKEAGSYQVTWDATGFPSGVYFYRLAAEGFVETRKMLLMR